MKSGRARRRPPRDTGPSSAMRERVMQRCGYSCERCGCGAEGGLQIHHRKPRRMGGSSDPFINYPSNLVLLCDACHMGAVEKYRTQAYADGFLVHAAHDPGAIPVKIYAHGYVLLANDGRYAAVPK